VDPVRPRRIIKKRSGGHGHHGGAWKVAYADFVTAMMALFMVMWLLASTDAQSRKEISNYFRTGILPDGSLAMNHAAQWAPSVIEVSPIPPPKGQETILDQEHHTAAAIKQKLTRLASVDHELAALAKNVTVEVTDQGVLIQAVDEEEGLLFDVSSADMKPALVRLLRGLAPLLAETEAPIEIDGHTDARPFTQKKGPRGVLSNWDLSFQRADAARVILELGGVPTDKIAGVFARGSSQLYLPDQPYAPQNRRLSLLVRADGGGRHAAGGSGAPVVPGMAPVVPPIVQPAPAHPAPTGPVRGSANSADDEANDAADDDE
jgi:chemotaxis protein MotB